MADYAPLPPTLSSPQHRDDEQAGAEEQDLRVGWAGAAADMRRSRREALDGLDLEGAEDSGSSQRPQRSRSFTAPSSTLERQSLLVEEPPATTPVREAFRLLSSSDDPPELLEEEFELLQQDMQRLLASGGRAEARLGAVPSGWWRREEGAEDSEPTISEEQFVREWWEQHDDATREHVEKKLAERQQDRIAREKRIERARARSTVFTGNALDSVANGTVNLADTIGLGRDGRLGRVLGRETADALDAVHMGAAADVVQETAGDLAEWGAKGMGVVSSGCDWVTDTLPGYPSRFRAWLKEPVLISDETSELDWWKIFVLHFLSYCAPPLIFWRRTHKVPAGHQTTTYGHGRSLKFVQNLFWWLTSISVALMWYLGKLPSLVKSEVWVNIGLYLFLAVMESHEEASLSKPREQERATKIALRSKNDDDLPSFSDFDEISQEMELHRQMSRRVGATEQRLFELDTLKISEPRFDSFDQLHFSRDFAKEIAEARAGVLTDFNGRFTEMIISLGRHVPWFNREVELIAKPETGDPHFSAKRRQYSAYLIRTRQSRIAQLRVAGQVDKAERLERRLLELRSLDDDYSKCLDLLDELDKLGEEERNVVLRIAPPLVLGCILLWIGDFGHLFAQTAEDAVASNMSSLVDVRTQVTKTLDNWRCAWYCYLARILSFFFLFSALLIAVKFLLNLLVGLTRRICARVCCKRCCVNPQTWAERQLEEQKAEVQSQLNRLLGPDSESHQEEAKTWDIRTALAFLGKGDAEDGPARARAKQAAYPQRRLDVAKALKLSASDESLDDFIKTELDQKTQTLWRRLCSSKGRQQERLRHSGNRTPRGGNRTPVRADSEDSEAEEEDGSTAVAKWRLMIATFQRRCKEEIDRKVSAPVVSVGCLVLCCLTTEGLVQIAVQVAGEAAGSGGGKEAEEAGQNQRDGPGFAGRDGHTQPRRIQGIADVRLLCRDDVCRLLSLRRFALDPRPFPRL